jgi:glycosyltransferase involved in cell wall biosynthesis
MNELYLRVFGARIIKSASRLLALSNSEADQYKLLGIPNLITEIVPNAIDPEEFRSLPSKGEFRSRYKIPMNEPVILSLGRLHSIKGLDMLLEAFSESTKNVFANSKLVIAGPDDGFLHTLKRMVLDLCIQDRVIITGPLYDRDKLCAFVDANVFVLSSRYETFPNTVLESWACGTPVIATDRCGIANLIDGAGLVVRHSMGDLSIGIMKILSDEEFRTRLSNEGTKRVMNEFSWPKVVMNVERIYEEVIATQKPRSLSHVP